MDRDNNCAFGYGFVLTNYFSTEEEYNDFENFVDDLNDEYSTCIEWRTDEYNLEIFLFTGGFDNRCNNYDAFIGTTNTFINFTVDEKDVSVLRKIKEKYQKEDESEEELCWRAFTYSR